MKKAYSIKILNLGDELVCKLINDFPNTKIHIKIDLFSIGVDQKFTFGLNIFNNDEYFSNEFGNNIKHNLLRDFSTVIDENNNFYIETFSSELDHTYYYLRPGSTQVYYNPESRTRITKNSVMNDEFYTIVNNDQTKLIYKFAPNALNNEISLEYDGGVKYLLNQNGINSSLDSNPSYAGPKVFFQHNNLGQIFRMDVFTTSYLEGSNNKKKTVDFIYENNYLSQIKIINEMGVTSTYNFSISDPLNWEIQHIETKQSLKLYFDNDLNLISVLPGFVGETNNNYLLSIENQSNTIMYKYKNAAELKHFDENGNINYTIDNFGNAKFYKYLKSDLDYFISSESNALPLKYNKIHNKNLISNGFFEENLDGWTFKNVSDNVELVEEPIVTLVSVNNSFYEKLFSSNGINVKNFLASPHFKLSTYVENVFTNRLFVLTGGYSFNNQPLNGKNFNIKITPYFKNEELINKTITKTIKASSINEIELFCEEIYFDNEVDLIKIDFVFTGGSDVNLYGINLAARSYGKHYYYNSEGLLYKTSNGIKSSFIKNKNLEITNINYPLGNEEIHRFTHENYLVEKKFDNNYFYTLTRKSKIKGTIEQIEKRTQYQTPGLIDEIQTIEINYNDQLLPIYRKDENLFETSLTYYLNTDLVLSCTIFDEITTYDYDSLSINLTKYQGSAEIFKSDCNFTSFGKPLLQQSNGLSYLFTYDSYRELTSFKINGVTFQPTTYISALNTPSRMQYTKQLNNVTYRIIYDNLDRVSYIEKTGTNSSVLYGFTYDNSLDVLTSVYNKESNTYVNFSYNEYDNVVSQNTLNFTISNNYDDKNLLSKSYLFDNSSYFYQTKFDINFNNNRLFFNYVNYFKEKDLYICFFDADTNYNDPQLDESNDTSGYFNLTNNFYSKNDYVIQSNNFADMPFYTFINGHNFVYLEEKSLKFIKPLTSSLIENMSIAFFFNPLTEENANVFEIKMGGIPFCCTYKTINNVKKLVLSIISASNSNIASFEYNLNKLVDDYYYLCFDIRNVSGFLTISYFNGKEKQSNTLRITQSFTTNNWELILGTELESKTDDKTKIYIGSIITNFNKKISDEIIIYHFLEGQKLLNLNSNSSLIEDQHKKVMVATGTTEYSQNISHTYFNYEKSLTNIIGEKKYYPISKIDESSSIIFDCKAYKNAYYSYNNSLIYKTDLTNQGTVSLTVSSLDEKKAQNIIALNNDFISFGLSYKFVNNEGKLYFNYLTSEEEILLSSSFNITNINKFTLTFLYLYGVLTINIYENQNHIKLFTINASEDIVNNPFYLYVGCTNYPKNTAELEYFSNCSFNGFIYNLCILNSPILQNSLNSLINKGEYRYISSKDHFERPLFETLYKSDDQFLKRDYNFITSGSYTYNLLSSINTTYSQSSDSFDQYFFNSFLTYNNEYISSIYNHLNLSNAYEETTSTFTYSKKQLIKEELRVNNLSRGINNRIYRSQYTYDNDGNILSINKTGYTQSTTAFTYSSSIRNLLTKYNNNSLSYDGLYLKEIRNSNGIILKRFEYRGNKITSIYSSSPSSNTLFYYDYKGRRIRKMEQYSNEDIKYFYDENDKLIREDHNEFSLCYSYDATGKPTILEYRSNSNAVIAKYFYQFDALNNVVGILNEQKEKVVSYIYDAYGNTLEIFAESNDLYNIANKNPFRYKGYYYDIETQLYWVSSRYYSPELCRWISPDSIEYLDPESITGLNLYCYCMNNPIMHADPSGHLAISTLIIGAIIGFVVGGATSAITQGLTNGWDNINGWQVLLDAVIGGISGVLGASGINQVVSMIAGGVLGAAGSVGGDLIESGGDWSQVNVEKAIILGVIGAGLGRWTGAGTQNPKAMVSTINAGKSWGSKAFLTSAKEALLRPNSGLSLQTMYMNMAKAISLYTVQGITKVSVAILASTILGNVIGG